MHKIGVLITLEQSTDLLGAMQRARAVGCECCQLSVWDTSLYTDEMAARITRAAKETEIEISTLWAGWSGPKEWNFTAGPVTLGIVPEAYREMRVAELIKGADFAVKLGVSRMATHAGFLPENMTDPHFEAVVATLRRVVDACAERGLNFLFETGQETPVALLRVIEAIGADNVGINMDTANLILYGKANSADAVSVFGKYVMDTHVKDGCYPTDGKHLGREVKVGEGLANVPEVIRRLRARDYKGNFVIEREISGEQQARDVAATVAYLKSILQ